MTALAFSNGLLDFGAAVPVVLGAGSAIAPPLSGIIWLSTAQEDLFDEVHQWCSSTKERSPGRLSPHLCCVPPKSARIALLLVQEGLGVLMARGREVRPSHKGSKIGMLQHSGYYHSFTNINCHLLSPVSNIMPQSTPFGTSDLSAPLSAIFRRNMDSGTLK